MPTRESEAFCVFVESGKIWIQQPMPDSDNLSNTITIHPDQILTLVKWLLELLPPPKKSGE